jgi:hypothetical protein
MQGYYSPLADGLHTPAFGGNPMKNERVLCECIDTKIGSIYTAGGNSPLLIMELYAEPNNATLTKFFNCQSKTKGCYTVPHNSDFAKLYRLTFGENPTKRFSKAHQLLGHFLGCRFFVGYETAASKKNGSYRKVTHIEPEKPILNDAWVATGALKKSRKSQLAKTLEKGDEVATSRRRQNAASR